MFFFYLRDLFVSQFSMAAGNWFDGCSFRGEMMYTLFYDMRNYVLSRLRLSCSKFERWTETKPDRTVYWSGIMVNWTAFIFKRIDVRSSLLSLPVPFSLTVIIRTTFFWTYQTKTSQRWCESFFLFVAFRMCAVETKFKENACQSDLKKEIAIPCYYCYSTMMLIFQAPAWKKLPQHANQR